MNLSAFKSQMKETMISGLKKLRIVKRTPLEKEMARLGRINIELFTAEVSQSILPIVVVHSKPLPREEAPSSTDATTHQEELFTPLLLSLVDLTYSQVTIQRLVTL